jgi:hypothetical protein
MDSFNSKGGGFCVDMSQQPSRQPQLHDGGWFELTGDNTLRRPALWGSLDCAAVGNTLPAPAGGSSGASVAL